MSDEVLLALAARAANIQLTPLCTRWDDDSAEMVDWNPLTDDGDALRLAVKLGLSIHIDTNQPDERAEASLPDTDVFVDEASRHHGGDLHAAARRAIVRAAARIRR